MGVSSTSRHNLELAASPSGRRRKLCSTAAAVAASLLALQAAQAQQTGSSAPPAPPQGAGSDQAGTSIVVTGSRIRRATSSAPTTQTDAETIQDLGLTSVGDILQTMPTFGVGQGSQTVNHSSADAGSAYADLRALGSTRTLVLLDGRRRAPGSAVSSAVDLTMVAPSLIETVDVVTGGASAVYGADAVSGVVNLRLKRNIRGIVAGARAGITHAGGGNEYDAYVGAGSAFAAGKGNASLILGYNKLGQLSSMDRDFTLVPRRLFANPDDRSVGDGQPAQIVLNDFRFANFDRGGTICLSNADGTISRFVATPGGIRPFQGQRVGPSGCSTNSLGGDGINPAKQLNLRSGVESIAVISQLSYSLSTDLQAYVNVDLSNSKTVVVGEEVADSQSQLIIRRDNPFVPAALAAELDRRGLTQFGLGRSHFDFGRREQRRHRDAYTVETGLKGNIGKAWNWEGFAQHGEYRAKTSLLGDRINANFFKAVDVVRDPVTGRPVCRDTAATGCVPLNVLGEGVASPEALAYVLHTTRQHLTSKQTVAGGSIGGDLLTLPAGPVKVVAGLEYRKESLQVTPDSLSLQRALFQGLGVAKLDASFNVTEGYLEGLVPLVKDLPFARSVSLEGAVRFSDYNTIGRTTAGRVGGTWEVAQPLSLRVQRSTSVRAPSLFELFGPETTSRANVTDPCSGALRLTNPNRNANCAALGLPSSYTDPRAAESEFILAGGNAALKPEKSKSWTIGSVFKGSLAGRSFQASIDYWSIDIEQAIQGLGIDRIINGCVDASTTANPLCALVARDPANGGITTVRNYAVNIASLKAAGIDYQFRYFIDAMPSLSGSGSAELMVALSGTELRKREELTNANDPSTLNILAGEIGFPKRRVNLQLRYTDGPATVSWSSRYIGPVKLDVQLPREFYPDGVNDVKSRLYHDLTAYYAVNKTLTIQAGVRNLFNLNPPDTPQHAFGNSAYAGIGSGGLYDNVGRTYLLGLSLKM